MSESVQGGGATASKEANKSESSISFCHVTCPTPLLTQHLPGVAKDSDASLSSRAGAAKDAVGDKMDETSHNVS